MVEAFSAMYAHMQHLNYFLLPKPWERGYEKLSADFVPHRAHIHVVLSRKTPLHNSFTVSIYWFDTTALGSMEFISISCALHLRLCFGF